MERPSGGLFGGGGSGGVVPSNFLVSIIFSTRDRVKSKQ